MNLALYNFMNKDFNLDNYLPNPYARDNPYDNKFFESFGKEYGYILQIFERFPEKIHTLVEIDGIRCIIPEYTIINRLGYFITR